MPDVKITDREFIQLELASLRERGWDESAIDPDTWKPGQFWKMAAPLASGDVEHVGYVFVCPSYVVKGCYHRHWVRFDRVPSTASGTWRINRTTGRPTQSPVLDFVELDTCFHGFRGHISKGRWFSDD